MLNWFADIFINSQYLNLRGFTRLIKKKGLSLYEKKKIGKKDLWTLSIFIRSISAVNVSYFVRMVPPFGEYISTTLSMWISC